MPKEMHTARQVVGFKTRIGFNSYDKTVPIRHLGFHLKRKITLPEVGELFQDNFATKSTTTLEHRVNSKSTSMQDLKVSFAQKKVDEFINDTKAWEVILKKHFVDDKYNILPATAMLQRAVSAGYTIFEVFQIWPNLQNQSHRGRRMYWLVKDDDPRSILIDDYLTSQNAARFYIAYLHEDNFSIFADQYKPMLWHQHLTLNHQHNTEKYMVDMFEKLLTYLDELHSNISRRAKLLEKNWFGESGPLLKQIFDLRCDDAEKSIAYALRLAKDPNFSSYDWVSKQYAIRHAMISGKIFGKTKKGDWKFDKPLWGSYTDMDRKMDAVYDRILK